MRGERDPIEGFYYDLVALRELAGQSNAVTRALAVRELRRRVLDRYDTLVPAQRESLVAFLAASPPGTGMDDSALNAEWAERLRARGLSARDRGALAQSLDIVAASLTGTGWLEAKLAGHDFLLTRAESGDILALRFDEARLIRALNSRFGTVAADSGIRLECRKSTAQDGAAGSEASRLAARRLPAPLESISVVATPADPLAFLANARLQSRLYRWGGLLLLISVLAGGGLVWYEAAREIRRARERSEFAATVSHDLRTPLASMRMLAESLQMGVADEGKRKTFLGAIIKESDRLSRLTDRALYFIRYGQGSLRYQFTEGDLGILVRDVVETFSVGVGSEVAVTLDLAPDLPAVRFDDGALEQVIFNLLDNAVKYSNPKQVVCVEVAVNPDPAGVRLSVTDHGMGMSEEDRHRILKPYVRGKGASGRNARGMGLGLAVCLHVVKAHRGTFQIESEPGQGSTFSVILPSVEGP